MNEISEYVLDVDVKELDKNVNYEEYWNIGTNLRDGTWSRYEVLPAFAIALGVKNLKWSQKTFQLHEQHTSKQAT